MIQVHLDLLAKLIETSQQTYWQHIINIGTKKDKDVKEISFNTLLSFKDDSVVKVVELDSVALKIHGIISQIWFS